MAHGKKKYIKKQGFNITQFMKDYEEISDTGTTIITFFNDNFEDYIYPVKIYNGNLIIDYEPAYYHPLNKNDFVVIDDDGSYCFSNYESLKKGISKMSEFNEKLKLSLKTLGRLSRFELEPFQSR